MPFLIFLFYEMVSFHLTYKINKNEQMKVREIKVSYSLPKTKKIKVHNSDELYRIAINHWNLDTIEMQEELKAILLNRANEVIGIYELSKGGISGTVLDMKLLLSVALKCLASSIALVHNHPSRNLKPSEADYRITKKLKSACRLVDIILLDHIIISKDEHYSFADEGKL